MPYNPASVRQFCLCCGVAAPSGHAEECATKNAPPVTSTDFCMTLCKITFMKESNSEDSDGEATCDACITCGRCRAGDVTQFDCWCGQIDVQTTDCDDAIERMTEWARANHFDAIVDAALDLLQTRTRRARATGSSSSSSSSWSSSSSSADESWPEDEPLLQP